MARLAVILAVCVTAPYISGANAVSASSEDAGMYYASLAYDSVCWWEYLKQIPTNSKGFQDCSGKASFQKDFVTTDPFFKKYPTQRQTTFAKGVQRTGLQGQLPQDYTNNCGKYLDDPKANPAADESDALNDFKQKYPFRAFAHCLLHTLRERHGDQAVEDVKNEKTHSRRNWVTNVLEQQNKLRALHGQEPLGLMKELMEGAQEWADVNARSCHPHHTTNEARYYDGQDTGENIYGGVGDDSEVAAYEAADAWYEEIKDYPYPGGFKGQLHDPLFEKIGHFTQSVWKGSKYVGYGYAYNKDCPEGTYSRYIVARYFPAGNMPGKYQENVLPKQ